ncbi:unnamed protein product [Linum tenue]|uniref:ABC-2 type transporter transmembrane domain-containing protein n=1 Tax=Linum tenue TaxID=586396 RepID=A0AAV0GQG8_9ROSI|nr:unnamed protein product [Linum tenue]
MWSLAKKFENGHAKGRFACPVSEHGNRTTATFLCRFWVPLPDKKKPTGPFPPVHYSGVRSSVGSSEADTAKERCRSILYSMVKFHPDFSHLLYFCINLFFCISVSEACVFFTASLISNPLPAMGAAVGVTVLNLMPSVVFRPIPDLPKIFWRYPLSYISYAAWGTQGNLKNDMMGLEFDSAIPGRPKITGEFILENNYGVNLGYSKWRDVAALFCLLLAYRVLLVFTLHYKQRISSPFRRMQPREISNPPPFSKPNLKNQTSGQQP